MNNSLIEIVKNVVCNYYLIANDELVSNCRTYKMCIARAMVCKLLREYGLSLSMIGRVVNRDHSTVINSIRSIDNLIEIYGNFKRDYEYFKKQINEKQKELYY